MGERKYSTLGFAVSMALFTVFALFLTLVLLTGASSFGNVSAAVEERFSERTVLLYVTQKIRMCDRAGGISVQTIDGASTLVLENYYEDVYYDSLTEMTIYIYAKDGYLNELYTFEGEEPNFNLGTRLFPADSAVFERKSPSLIKITVNGRSAFVNVNSDMSGER